MSSILIYLLVEKAAHSYHHQATVNLQHSTVVKCHLVTRKQDHLRKT